MFSRCSLGYELARLYIFETLTFEDALVLRDAAQMNGYADPIWKLKRAKVFLVEAEEQEQFSIWPQDAHQFPQYHFLAFEVIERLDAKRLCKGVRGKRQCVRLPTLEAQIWESGALNRSALHHSVGDVDADDLRIRAESVCE